MWVRLGIISFSKYYPLAVWYKKVIKITFEKCWLSSFFFAIIIIMITFKSIVISFSLESVFLLLLKWIKLSPAAMIISKRPHTNSTIKTKLVLRSHFSSSKSWQRSSWPSQGTAQIQLPVYRCLQENVATLNKNEIDNMLGSKFKPWIRGGQPLWWKGKTSPKKAFLQSSTS